MYKVVILEDSVEAMDTLISFLNRYGKERGLELQILPFSNAFDFLERYEFDADVIFFDIEMPGMSGMEAAKKIREKDTHALIVFATNLAQFAIEGYSVNAFDFILKPITYPAMELKFGRIFHELEHRNREETITVTKKGGMNVIKVSEILYVEVKNHNLVYHLEDEEILTWGSMASAYEKLLPYHFALANACYLVNLRHVKGIEGSDVLVGRKRLAISKGKRKSFLSELAQYFGGSI